MNYLPRMANIGTGTKQLFKQETESDLLEIRSLNVLSPLALPGPPADKIDIQIQANMTNIGAGSGSIYSGTGLFATANNFRTLLQDTGITVATVGDTVKITNSKPENTTVANVGTGAGLPYRDKTVDQINLKTIKAGSGISVTNNADDITIANSAAPPETIPFEQTVSFGDMFGRGANLVQSAWATADVNIYGWQFTYGETDRLAFWLPIHEDYAGGLIQWRWYGCFSSASSSSTHTFRLQGRWHANGDLGDVAFTGTDTATSPASGTGARMIVSALASLTPDGSYSAGKQLLCHLQRTDSNSDNVLLQNVKLRYSINI